MLSIQSVIDSLHDFRITKASIQNGNAPLFRIAIAMDPFDIDSSNTMYVLNISLAAQITEVDQFSLFICLDSKTESVCPLKLPNYIVVAEKERREQLICLLKTKLQAANRVLAAERVISECLYSGAELNKLLLVAADLLGNPIILQDSSTKLVAHSHMLPTDIEDDEIFTALFSDGFVPADMFDKYDYTYVLKAIHIHSKAFELKSELKKSRIIARLKVNNYYFGWVLTACVRRPFAEEDLQIMDALAGAVRITMEKSVFATAFSAAENVLLDLLEAPVSAAEVFEKRFAGFGLVRLGEYQLLLLTKRDPTQTEESMQIMMAYKNHLTMLFSQIKAFYYDNKLVCVVDKAGMAQGEQIIENFLNNADLLGVVSDIFYDLLELPRYFRRCKSVLETGIKLKKDTILFHYRDMYLHHGLSILNNAAELESLLLPQLLIVLRHDEQHHSDLAKTVRAYLNIRNVGLTAQYLHMHRNTVLYRLERFTEISGLNLQEGEDIYKLWLAFQALDLLG